MSKGSRTLIDVHSTNTCRIPGDTKDSHRIPPWVTLQRHARQVSLIANSMVNYVEFNEDHWSTVRPLSLLELNCDGKAEASRKHRPLSALSAIIPVNINTLDRICCKRRAVCRWSEETMSICLYIVVSMHLPKPNVSMVLHWGQCQPEQLD